MTAKDIQTEFIKTYLKPTLKNNEYKTSGQTWWKNKGDFFIVINLQNSLYNNKEELSFCLNIGIALTAILKNKEKKKATYFDLLTNLRENSYLSEDRIQIKKNKGGWLGYKITNNTNLTEFIDDFRIDLENNILKQLDKLNTLNDCVQFYDNIEFWGANLRRQIENNGIKY